MFNTYNTTVKISNSLHNIMCAGNDVLGTSYVTCLNNYVFGSSGNFYWTTSISMIPTSIVESTIAVTHTLQQSIFSQTLVVASITMLFRIHP